MLSVCTRFIKRAGSKISPVGPSTARPMKAAPVSSLFFVLSQPSRAAAFSNTSYRRIQAMAILTTWSSTAGRIKLLMSLGRNEERRSLRRITSTYSV